jgi:membrane protease subunit HflC
MQYNRVYVGTDRIEAPGSANVILSPDNEYLRQFRGRER